MGLNVEEVEAPASEALVKARLLDKALNPGRPTAGPEPKSWKGSTGRDVNRTAFTYAFRLGLTDIWKIGHAIDVKEGLKQVNCHIPPEAVPEPWDAKFQQAWDSETGNSVWKRFDRLSKAGVFETFFDHLATLSSSAHLVQMFDSAVVRAHVSAAGAKGGRKIRRSVVRAAASRPKSI